MTKHPYLVQLRSKGNGLTDFLLLLLSALAELLKRILAGLENPVHQQVLPRPQPFILNFTSHG